MLIAVALATTRPRRRAPFPSAPSTPATSPGGPLATLGRHIRRAVAALATPPDQRTGRRRQPRPSPGRGAAQLGEGATSRSAAEPAPRRPDAPDRGSLPPSADSVAGRSAAEVAGSLAPDDPDAGGSAPPVRTGGAEARASPGEDGDGTAAEDPVADAWIGAAAAVALVALVIAPVLVPLPLAAAAIGPRITRRRAEEVRRRAWSDALPDAVDLLALGLGSGLAVAPALALAAPRTPPPLGPALARAHDRIVHGAPLAEALDQVARDGPASRPLVALLVAAHRDGAPVVAPLARLADELRAERRRAVEARARQVPVRLLFPLVLCSLPAFVLLAIVPPVVAALTDLRS